MSALESRLRAENQRLRDELEEKAERVRQLEEYLRPVIRTPARWGLSPSEERILAALLQRDWLSSEALVEACRRHDNVDDPKIVATHVSRMRKKFGLTDPVIRTLYGRGYSLRDRLMWRQRLLFVRATELSGATMSGEAA